MPPTSQSSQQTTPPAITFRAPQAGDMGWLLMEQAHTDFGLPLREQTWLMTL